MTKLLRAAALTAAAVLALGACAAPDSEVSSADPSAVVTAPATSVPATSGPVPSVAPSASSPEVGAAAAALDDLPVKGRGPRTGYDRDEFGPRWADADRNGCDTRNDILRRDLRSVAVKPGTRGCVVASGVLLDPYSGATVRFVRGASTSRDVQIDHVVSLSNAWQTGAAAWSTATRTSFANDPLNLLAVDGDLNAAKGDGDAATWLPPDRSAWCPMVARQIAVKRTYGLWVTPPERVAMTRVLSTCPQEPLPAG